MKILITGSTGKVGSQLVNLGGIPILVDITDDKAVRRAFSKYKNEAVVVIHCAAVTDPDECEADPNKAVLVNAHGATNVASALSDASTFIYLSSDHVFNGKMFFDYSEFHRPNPVNEYGLSKYLGEQGLRFATSGCKKVIVRTSKLFTNEDVLGVVERLENNQQVDTVSFIYRSFAYLPDFARVLWQYASDGRFPTMRGSFGTRVINISGRGSIPYSVFLKQVCDVFGLGESNLNIRDIQQEGYTPRPLRGGLSTRFARGHGYVVEHYLKSLESIRDKREL